MEYKLIDSKEQLTRVKRCGRMDVPGVKQVENAFTEHIAKPGKPCIINMTEITSMIPVAKTVQEAETAIRSST